MGINGLIIIIPTQPIATIPRSPRRLHCRHGAPRRPAQTRPPRAEGGQEAGAGANGHREAKLRPLPAQPGIIIVPYYE